MTKNFTIHEFASKDGKAVPKDLLPNLEELVKNLQVIRDELGEPLTILSGYRSPEHNRRVGGKTNSFHLRAMAADLTTKSKTPRQLHALIERLISEKKIKQGGLGLYPGFVHYDIRGRKARW